MRTGQPLISSVDSGDPHTHTIDGHQTSADSGDDHTHTVEIGGLPLVSGPPIADQEIALLADGIQKGLLPELIDPNHAYVFRTGEYGIYDYWYIDQAGNYWKYTNAPEDDVDHDPRFGIPLLVKEQPMPHTAPSFFTVEGRKRHMAVPEGLVPERNPEYTPLDSRKIWYEVYQGDGGAVRYVYLDADVRENLDLWVQYQLRVTAASLANYRKYATDLFSLNHPKDRIMGALLMLVDQGLYEIDELINALVMDLDFIGDTVKLLGRKFTCDPVFLDFLTSLQGDKDPSSPLFEIETYHGKAPLGRHYVFSVFKQLRVSPHYLQAWHASHQFSKVVHRLLAERLPAEEAELRAFSELKQIFNTRKDVRHLVDYKVKETLLRNYEQNSEEVEKGLPRIVADDFGVGQIFSDLAQLFPSELEFAEWLHAEPLHVITPEEEAQIEAALTEMNEEAEAEEQPGQPAEGGAGADEGVPGGRPETAAPGPEE